MPMSECVSVISVPACGRGEGEGQEETHVSDVCGASLGSEYFRGRMEVAVWPRDGDGCNQRGPLLAEIQKARKCRPRTGRFWEMSQSAWMLAGLLT